MRDCSKCKYHDDEVDMGGGIFIVCNHPDSTCNWLDICQLDAINDIIKIMIQFRNRQGNSKDDIKAFNYVIDMLEEVNKHENK